VHPPISKLTARIPPPQFRAEAPSLPALCGKGGSPARPALSESKHDRVPALVLRYADPLTQMAMLSRPTGDEFAAIGPHADGRPLSTSRDETGSGLALRAILIALSLDSVKDLKMELLLHAPNRNCNLSAAYKRAFDNAAELFVVSAFLTEWDTSLKLNSGCGKFRLIVGKDFGITRKSACQKVMRWLPSTRKHDFRVADGIGGFHPKAVFWKETDGKCFAVIGSSNLTDAAFGSNVEANVFLRIDGSEYRAANLWLNEIERLSIPVDEGWLEHYREANLWPLGGRGARPQPRPVLPLELPAPARAVELVNRRRAQLKAFNKVKSDFRKLFKDCASGRTSSAEFYSKLPTVWNECRLQGKGFEIKGKHSDFQTLSGSILRIMDSNEEDRDDIVRAEIDRLAKHKIPTRGAFLSEMLCLNFPDKYPVLADPTWKFLKDKKFRALRGASEGSSYIRLALALRSSIAQNPKHPAKDLAELDTVIWLAYGK